jgi:hypothetical protein
MAPESSSFPFAHISTPILIPRFDMAASDLELEATIHQLLLQLLQQLVGMNQQLDRIEARYASTSFSYCITHLTLVSTIFHGNFIMLLHHWIARFNTRLGSTLIPRGPSLCLKVIC